MTPEQIHDRILAGTVTLDDLEAGDHCDDDVYAASQEIRRLRGVMRWQPIGDEPRRGSPGTILLANGRGELLGEFTGRVDDDFGTTWSIGGALWDGDEPPVWWLRLPEVAR